MELSPLISIYNKMKNSSLDRIFLSFRSFLIASKIRFNWIKRFGKLDYFYTITRNQRNAAKKQTRVLIGPSFSLWAQASVIDRTLALALELKDCEIFPVYCDQLQTIECNCVGGLWGGGADFERNCNRCFVSSQVMWSPYNNNLQRLSSYIDFTFHNQKIDDLLHGLDLENLLVFRYDNIDYGELAKDILVNNFLVSSIELVPNSYDLIKVHIKNLMLVKESYENLLDAINPDRVISNDSYYGMWRLMQILCSRRSTPFYSHWPITKERVAISYADAAMNLDMTSSWPKFKQIPLKSNDQARIDSWLAGKRSLVIDSTKPAHNMSDSISLESLDFAKPTILIAANVVWDLAALNKQIVFRDMMDWIAETIKYFEVKSDYQLIIKPHPAEVAPSIPQTVETVEFGLSKRKITIPPNVVLMKPQSSITVNYLKQNVNVRGVAVHTTTVGFEYPAQGIPSITTAKSPYRGFGFTKDPVTPNEYFECIDNLLSSDKSSSNISETEIDLARKFIKFYQFHYSAKIDLFDGDIGNVHKDFLTKISEKKGVLNYITDQIILGNSINCQKSWLPES